MRILLLLLALSRTAFAFTGVYGNDTSRARVEVADVPGHPDLVLVGWEDLPGTAMPGAMILRRDRGDTETRYLAVGGGGLVALVDRGGATLIAGTLVPVIEAVTDDPAHPLALVLERGRKVDAAALAAKYAAFEHVGAPGESRAAIEAAITARAAKANKACGAHVAPAVQWAEFAKAGKLALAKQTVAIYDALEAACADKDYRAAIAGLGALRVGLRGDGLALSVKAGELAVELNDAAWNPRETAARWLEDNL
ncbi:MAG TPA: hypothetical protein VLX92_29025 [Kofleriaceae bacterium]|nr:hypothetical protein [Kofleriaceae bacterium]